MNGQLLRPLTPVSLLTLTLALVLLGPTGCRLGQGEECLTDSDCEEGLICVKRTQVIHEVNYESKHGTCFRDTDEDGVPDDYYQDDNGFSRTCGVHAFPHPDTGAETVQEEYLTRCNDNCPKQKNARILRSFECFAKDDCCPAPADRKASARSDDLCTDVTDQQDTCRDCLDAGMPPNCYMESGEYAKWGLSLGLGLDLDANGCMLCRPLSRAVTCTFTGGECAQAVATGALPAPACSGAWTCSADAVKPGYCYFVPALRKTDEDRWVVNFQLDMDWDGVGDECDNCPTQPNPDQANRDGDTSGDACDLCPDVPSLLNKDLDRDGLGDVCDPDDDNDGVCDPGQTDPTCTGSDNCPTVWNEDQADLDLDGLGDACDSDRDGDGIKEDGNTSGVVGDYPCRGPALMRLCDDNCPDVSNDEQLDSDGDGVGDACDPD